MQFLLQLNLRDMAAWDHDKPNESTSHIDFDCGAFGLWFLLPRLGFYRGSFLHGRGRGKSVLKGVGKDDVSFL